LVCLLIQRYHQNGESQTQIADKLDRNRSTIGRELRRNASEAGRYSPCARFGFATSQSFSQPTTSCSIDTAVARGRYNPFDITGSYTTDSKSYWRR